MKTIQTCVLGILIGVALVIPGTVSAQAEDVSDEAVRAEFRSALLADPRSAALSENDFNAMVDALLGEARTQGVVTDFVLPPLPEVVVVEQSAGDIITPWGQPVSMSVLYATILVSLFLAGFLLWHMLRLHKQHAQSA